MARPNPTAVAVMEQRIYRPVWFCVLDFLGDPIRASTLPWDVTITGSGDPSLDGYGFNSLSGKVISMGEVHNQEGGSETLTCSLSGLILPDNALMNLVADTANWYGRTARFWQGALDENNLFTGNIWHYHTGWMSSLVIGGGGEQQQIQLQVEGYLALLANASNRTYMDQTRIDPGDLSPELAMGTLSKNGRVDGGGGFFGSLIGSRINAITNGGRGG